MSSAIFGGVSSMSLSMLCNCFIDDVIADGCQTDIPLCVVFKADFKVGVVI